jgi:hypothetical protein
MAPSWRSPVVEVPVGSNMRIEPPAPGAEGRCSVPRGTTKVSPVRRTTVRIGDTVTVVAVPQRHVELAIQHQEELVRVVVDVPHVVAPGVGDADVVVVDAGHDARAVDLVDRRQRGVQVHGTIGHRLIVGGTPGRRLARC